MAQELIVFDMDGVLVDVSESYRETIVRTVEHFTGAGITREQIQDYKNQGGFNDDWKLSHHVIAGRGVTVEFQTVVDYFQGLFHGNGDHDGLIQRERWIARGGLFDRLARRFDFALFTGRMRWEAQRTLQRFAPALRFDPIVGMQEVTELKPAPEGLLKIVAEAGGRNVRCYIGDTVDDARCARSAEVPFIGICAPHSPRRAELAVLLAQEGAIAVLDDINQMEGMLT
jgi:HAD superfamily phosphatase